MGIFYDKQPFDRGLVRFGNVGANFLAKIKAQKDDFEIKFEKIAKWNKMRDLKERLNLERVDFSHEIFARKFEC